MATATLVKLSACDCGFPLLNESIGIGTKYELDLEQRQLIGLVCGGCGKTIRGLDGVFVRGRESGQRAGFLPMEVFSVDEEDSTRAAG